MPKLRPPTAEQVDAAIEELQALTADNRQLEVSRSGVDQVHLTVGRTTWPADVIVRDAVSTRDASDLIAIETRGSKIIVANQLSSEAKDLLTEHNATLRVRGWSWLDRRGELQLTNPQAAGTLQFSDARADRRTATGGPGRVAAPRSDGPIRGRAGISWATALLLDPENPPSIRAVAREAQMSHGAIGEASKLLRTAGLVLPDGKPDLPELFWSLAAVWGPIRAKPVAELPTPELAERLNANIDSMTTLTMIPGWCVAGDEATQAWGAPMFISGSRPRIWMPTEADARRAERELGTASWDDCAAVIAVPPTALVTLHREIQPSADRTLSFLPAAHPLFLALDLAQDPGRGREILDQWQPEHPEVQRVW